MAILSTDWSSLQDALITWVETVTGRRAVWRDDRQYVGSPNPYFLLHLQQLVERGMPGVVYDYDSSGDQMIPKQQRMLDITVEVSCIANNQRSGFLAQEELSKLRSKTWLPTMRDDLTTAGIALMDSRDVASVPFEFQGRLLSQATAEFVFSVHDIYQDTDLTESYISTVTDDPITDNDLVDVDWPGSPTP